ncbi:hypothetical protein FHS39_002564 [Streptomyces olivoverticillatus]|uniref:Uncharacterized protein n=1 Tax=Streptomyces olivoverticillatus TaxID=66427 RepID=A0A7W7LPN5_9ACTN|nr:hypothetical protein [Streptomyces olivoverticillatus]MBB4893533.1 hypothetical protein [Streptomyces olivoverticillatus]
MPENTTVRSFPTPLEEMRRRAQIIDARNALWPSEAEVVDAEAAVRAELIASFLAASAAFDQVAVDGALAEARTYDLANPDAQPVLDELIAIHEHSAEAA